MNITINCLPILNIAIIQEEKWNKTPLGIALLSVYALIAQVMLINLLIGMIIPQMVFSLNNNTFF